MADTFDLQHVERLELVVPAPPDEVAAWLAEQISVVPGRGTFRGHVRGGSFSLLRKVMAKRQMRPTLDGTLEAAEGGTRIVARCALPSWSRLMGRGVALWAAGFGVFWLLWGAFLVGVPDDPLAIAGALFMALVWLPFTGVMISGSMVSHAISERAATPAALEALVVDRWPDTELPQGLSRSDSDARPEQSRSAAPRRRVVEAP